MSLIGQLMFNGLSMGLIFVILAAGNVLIISVNKILFMAYGIFYTIGAYSVWYIIHISQLPYYLALIIAILIAGAMGIFSYVLVFHRLMSKAGGFLATLIASMGIMMLLSQGSLLFFGTRSQNVPTVFPGEVVLFGIRMTTAKLALIAISICVVAILFWIYEKTNLGRAMRTVSFLPEFAPLAGISVSRIYLLNLGLATALAGIAGGILAPTYGVTPNMGADVLWTVMLMTMLGGMDSLFGAVVGGIIIGQLLSFGQYYIGSTIQIIIFVIIGIVLYFRPNGILGHGINIGV